MWIIWSLIALVIVIALLILAKPLFPRRRDDPDDPDLDGLS